MLKEKITNSWIRFKIDGLNPKESFLYVIRIYSAYNFDKSRALNFIVEKCPEVLEDITEEEMLDAFSELYGRIAKRNEVMSSGEFHWISVYVKNPKIRKIMEQFLYNCFLRSEHYDIVRKEDFKWTIGEDEIKKVVNSVLADPNLRSKRKMQIAEEFGESAEEFKLSYFRRLLWDRHHDIAESLNINNIKGFEDAVMAIILDNINAGYISDAKIVATRFLSDRQDILNEIQEIEDKV